jgi:alcohol dehydrogenase (cytochrome c)
MPNISKKGVVEIVWMTAAWLFTQAAWASVEMPPPSRSDSDTQVGSEHGTQVPVAAPNYEDGTYRAVLSERQRLLGKIVPVTDAMLKAPPAADWLLWRRTYDNLSYSPLDEINRKNVQNLTVAWSWSLPVGPNEITPLIHDGVLFVNSANRVQALDAATGDLLWQYIRPIKDGGSPDSVLSHRSMAIYGDKVYVSTSDGHVVALNFTSGAVAWDHQVVPATATPRRPFLSAGPIAIHGKIIQGVSGCFDLGGGCFIVALDSETGTEVWRFNSVARPGTKEGDTWNGAPLNERYGGAVWTPGSYDPDLNLAYFGTGQLYDVAALLVGRGNKPIGNNDALYTDSTLALDPDTGRLAWYYQHHNRDVWDMDWAFERTLTDITFGGRKRRVAVTVGKLGIYDVLDRKDGRYLFSRDVGLQNLVSKIDPRTGKKSVNSVLEPQPNRTDTVCPYAGGARSWPTTAFNPDTKVLYLPLQESCMSYTWSPRDAAETAAGGMDISYVNKPRSDSDGKYGRVQAINVETGATIWMQRRRANESSSLLDMAGGIIFDGDRDRMFRASDDLSGVPLWQMRLNAVPSSSPITYSVNGRQYVAVVTGGGGPMETTFSVLTPEIKNPAGAVVLWVVALPGRSPSLGEQ